MEGDGACGDTTTGVAPAGGLRHGACSDGVGVKPLGWEDGELQLPLVKRVELM